MSYKLLIVESPTKVTSISKLLDQKTYKVTSSMGHVRDLPKKGGLNVDIANDFKPNYEVSADKKKIVAELKSLAAKADEVIMASDEDREGEAIAWHLCHILQLDPQTTKRIVFHEITASALKAALAQPRTINQDLVDAQQARRVLDRIVGFELSPVLWKKIRPGLSAGRVQSVAVRLICEQEETINQFEPTISCQGQGTFQVGNQEVVATLKDKVADLKQARDLLETCRTTEFVVRKIETKESFKNPSPPLKTSTLQQAAANKLGFSVKATMIAAQALYEHGFITYMRTDSLNLSQQALNEAKNYIVATFGDKYYRHKNYQTQTKGAQEAHEAIRPTNFQVTEPQAAKLSAQATKLYRLIWQRTLASQMSPAQTDRIVVTISSTDDKVTFNLEGQILRFAGFLEVTNDATDDVILPEMKVQQKLTLLEANIAEKFSKPPARFSEASLVQNLEEQGIGRPSTYAPTISTILDRGYVVKGDVEHKMRRYRGILLKKGQLNDYDSEDQFGGATNKLLPTDLAKLVTPFLNKHFSRIMDYNFTSAIENDFDKIAKGELAWTDHLQKFYQEFHPDIEATADISKNEAGSIRELGVDPADNQAIYARFGRFGLVLQKGLPDASEEAKPIFAPWPPDADFDTITLETALKMFQLPRVLGRDENGAEVVAKIGRFGPYVQIGQSNASLGKHDPFTITLEEAIQLVADQVAAKQKKVLADFGTLKVIDGRYGPYVTDGTKNGKIPTKDAQGQPIDLNNIQQADAEAWLEKYGKISKGRGRRPKK